MNSIMEANRSQAEFDELEKLLFEISLNPQSNGFINEGLGNFHQSPINLESRFSVLSLSNGFPIESHITGPFGGSFPGNFEKRTFADVDLQRLHGHGQLFNAPISNQYEPFWDIYTMPRCPNRSFCATRAWDGIGKQNFPEGFFGPDMANCGRFVRTSDLYPDDPTVLIRYDSLNEASGGIYLMAKDQYGCRFLQRKFSEGTREEVEGIFSEIIDHIVDLMKDPFGNYLIQKLLEVCDDDQRMRILCSITRNEGELVRVSCDMHGTRVVQKIIETLDSEEQFSMVVSSLEYNAVALMKNINGNHVAQKCLQSLMPEYNSFIFKAAIGNCVELARDRHGCCVLQKCLGRSDDKQRSRLIAEVASNSLILSQDPFGNYVVQFVFDLKLSWATEKVLDHLAGRFADLSVQKHSSNVVETCLKSASEERRSRIIQELIDNPRFDQIMRDPFGNYVTQVALDKSKGIIYAKLVDAIKPHVNLLRTSPYGKKVLTRLSLKK